MRQHPSWTCGIILTAVLCGSADRASGQTQEDFFRTDVVHDLHLTISRRDWQALTDHPEHDTYYAADLRWNGITLRNVGIRSRGHITRNGVKPGLRIDVNRYLSEQKFVGLTAFVLDNCYDDPSLLRERLSMQLFNRAGIAAPRETHTRLFINDNYAGVYAVVEAVDRAFLRRTLGDEEAHVEQGGFLFEYRWVRPYAFEYLGPELAAYAEIFIPETRRTDSVGQLYGRIETLIRLINEAPDDRFVELVGARLDLPLFMRYLAIENFLAESDGFVGEWGLHNVFFYLPLEEGQARLVPWDKDRTFADAAHPLQFRLSDNVLTRRAIAIPELRQLYVDALLSCAQITEQRDADPLDSRGWLEREIDRTADAIRGAVIADPVYPFAYDEFDRSVEAMRDFARRRPPAVRCRLDAGSDAAACDGRVPLVSEP